MQDPQAPVRALRVWDIPTRVFHWLLVALVAISIYTGNVGGLDEMRIHMLSGYAILALVLFRLVWGVIGSRHSRFTDFITGPGRILRYVVDLLKRRHAPVIGHNPLGALSVLALLAVLLGQAGTGLFANDDIFTEGPLAAVAGKALSDQLTSFHHRLSTILYVLIGLHLAAILTYQFLLKENLVRPMINGTKAAGPFPGAADVPYVSLWRAAVIAAVSGAAVWALITL